MHYLSLVEVDPGGLFTFNGSEVHLGTLVNLTILLAFLSTIAGVISKWMIIPAIVKTIERVVNGKIDSIAEDIKDIKTNNAQVQIRLAQGTEKFEYYDAMLDDRRDVVNKIAEQVNELVT